MQDTTESTIILVRSPAHLENAPPDRGEHFEPHRRDMSPCLAATLLRATEAELDADLLARMGEGESLEG